MRFVSRFINLIHRDVTKENEANKSTVILRVYILIMSVYFILQAVLLGSFKEWMVCTIAIILCLLYCGLFYATYKGKLKSVITAAQLFTLSWIIGYVYLLGWDSGVQHFLFVILLCSLVTTYHSTKIRLLLALLYCSIRLLLFRNAMAREPILSIDFTSNCLIQILNTVTIFSEITFLTSMFIKESQEMERKLVSYNEYIRELARKDALTGLMNRRSMLESIEEMLSSSPNNRSFCIAISDIDLFKSVNDSYGHEVGDAALKIISDYLENYMKKRGYVARWGGEEFLFVFHDGNGDEVKIELETMRAEIEKLDFSHISKDLHVTMTFGLEEYDPTKPIDTSITNADKKLYLGKNSGRNKVIF